MNPLKNGLNPFVYWEGSMIHRPHALSRASCRIHIPAVATYSQDAPDGVSRCGHCFGNVSMVTNRQRFGRRDAISHEQVVDALARFKAVGGVIRHEPEVIHDPGPRLVGIAGEGHALSIATADVMYGEFL
jgi:hypothetical protein